ncbi:MAG: ABC transporter ATP-binding protein [Candidatus Baldrarchaeia archaeon]
MVNLDKILVKELLKSFGNLKVLDNVTFSVKEGEFLCIVGPTGCGKTTLLKILANLIEADSGEVLIDGSPPNPKLHKIGYVPQSISLMPWRNVYSNIKLGLELRGVKEAEIFRRVMEVINLVGLAGFENYFPHQLSLGMKARVAIARALVIDPDVMLMDEPLANLDWHSRSIMQSELLRLHEKAGKTTVYVTHNVEEALLLADRIVVLTSRPARVKTEIEVHFKKPRNRFEGDFVLLRKRIENLVKEEE